MKWLFKKVEIAYNKKIDSTGLAIFRIFYFSVLFAEVYQLHYFKALVFDPIPFIESYEINLDIGLQFWLLSISFLIIGLFTRVAAIVNYLFTVTFLGTISSFEYHVFYLYLFANFIAIFISISKTLSIDSIIEKVKYSRGKFVYNTDKNTSVLSYYLFLFFGVGVMYFDSLFYKLGSQMWLKGLGVWLPATLPQMNHYGPSFALNQKWLMMFTSHLTLLIEFCFIFIFWYKKARWPLFIIGVGLHVGILIFFPIPWFGLAMFSLYLLLIPVSVWKKLSLKIKSKNPSYTFIYNDASIFSTRVRIVIQSLDIFNKIQFISIVEFLKLTDLGISKEELEKKSYSYSNRNAKKLVSGFTTYRNVLCHLIYTFPVGIFISIPGIKQIGEFIYLNIRKNETAEVSKVESEEVPCYSLSESNQMKKRKINLISFFIIFCLVLQTISLYNSPLIGIFKKEVHFEGTRTDEVLSASARRVTKKSKTFLGITGHSVFLDFHFRNYNHIVAVTYIDKKGNTIWLPIIDENGQPGLYIYGAFWAKWTFRVNSPVVNAVKLSNGLEKFTAFWAEKNNIPLEGATFKVMVKRIDIPWEWEYDFLLKQINKPWVEAGTVKWAQGRANFDIADIEKIKN